jgi:hypothetical protein
MINAFKNLCIYNVFEDEKYLNEISIQYNILSDYEKFRIKELYVMSHLFYGNNVINKLFNDNDIVLCQSNVLHFNKILFNELHKIYSTDLRKYILPLKGASNLKNIKKRILNDIDILVFDKKNTSICSKTLYRLGYIQERQENLFNNYELPEFLKSIELPEAFQISNYTKYATNQLCNINNKHIFICAVELHLGLFTYSDENIHILSNNDIKYISNKMQIKKTLNVVYLSIKFNLDVELLKDGDRIKMKCIKILKDIHDIIINFKQKDIEEAIGYSIKLNSTEHFHKVLKCISKYSNKVNFFNKEITENTILDEYFSAIKTIK